MNLSQEYIASIAIVIVSLLKAFGVNVGNQEISGIIVGVLALYTAFRRHQKGDITALGRKK